MLTGMARTVDANTASEKKRGFISEGFACGAYGGWVSEKTLTKGGMRLGDLNAGSFGNLAPLIT